MTKAIEIAKYLLSKKKDSAGKTLTNMELQKMLYFAQGFSLLTHNKPIFVEDIEAWDDGPVVPVVFHAFEKYGSRSLPRPEKFNINSVWEEDQFLLDDISVAYLETPPGNEKIFREILDSPWKIALAAGKNNVISHESLKEYFWEYMCELVEHAVAIIKKPLLIN